MWSRLVLALVLLTSYGAHAQCKPGDTCKAPDCRCWDDPESPGGLKASDIPQMVLISFEYAINRANVDSYRELFDGVTNPNNCQPKATFFVQDLFTDYEVVKELHDDGHEIGMTSETGDIPQTPEEWKQSYAKMRAEISGAGVPTDQIIGSRAPDLYVGGDDQFAAIEDSNLVYDSTCVSLEYTEKNNLIWPYTYDFVDTTPPCTIGTTPSQAHAGKWQFLVADLVFQGQKCASPSGCTPLVTNQQDSFNLLYDAFAKHYESPTKAPYILYIDPLWLTVQHQYAGTKQFLEFIRAAFDDTWILTTQQALAWIQDPVATSNITQFAPWQC